MKWSLIFLFFLAFSVLSCKEPEAKNHSKQVDTDILWVKMLVEIPAGTIKKYELNKTSGQLEMDSVDGKPRLIEYLGYPANYGMIPKTILPKNKGGDGDPLDIITIGPPAERGSIIDCKVIGILALKDQGEQDDKLIAISKGSSMIGINSVKELQKNYPGITEIIETWFTNYKGKGKMVSSGYKDKKAAQEIYSIAKQSFEE